MNIPKYIFVKNPMRNPAPKTKMAKIQAIDLASSLDILPDGIGR